MQHDQVELTIDILNGRATDQEPTAVHDVGVDERIHTLGIPIPRIDQPPEQRADTTPDIENATVRPGARPRNPLAGLHDPAWNDRNEKAARPPRSPEQDVIPNAAIPLPHGAGSVRLGQGIVAGCVKWIHTGGYVAKPKATAFDTHVVSIRAAQSEHPLRADDAWFRSTTTDRAGHVHFGGTILHRSLEPGCRVCSLPVECHRCQSLSA
jgi:hypothetical protein